MKLSKLELPLRTTLLYLLFGGLWILLSDQILSFLILENPQEALYQTLKGWFFIFVSGILLYLLLRRDFVGRQQAERAAQLENGRWQGIVEGIADEVWTCDAQGKMSLLNLKAVTAMGLDIFKDKSIEEVYQEAEIFYPDGQLRPLEQAPLLLSLRGEIVRGEEIMRHRQTGITRYRQFSSAPTRAANGEIAGAVAIVRDITDQKMAEEGLRRYELLSKHSRDAILFMRREDGRILEANDAALQAYGYSRDELLALTIRDLRAPDAQNLTTEQMAQAEAGGILFETIHRRKDGSTFPVEVSSRGATIGSVRTLVSIIRDLSERKQAEDRFNKAFHASPTALVISRQEDGCIEAINDTFIRFFGYTEEEVVGKTSTELGMFANPEDRQEAIQKLQNNGFVRNFELDVRLKSGEVRTASLSIEKMNFERVNAMLTMIQDITERKQMEEMLRANEERYRAVVEGALDAIIVSDPSGAGKILSANSAACHLFGYSAEEFLGLAREDILDVSDPKLAILIEKREQNGRATAELTYKCKDGTQFSGELSAAYFQDKNGERRSVSIIRDVTERKRAEEKLRHSEAMLRAILDQMPSGVTVRDAQTGDLILSNAHSQEIMGALVGSADQFARYRGFHPDGRPYQTGDWPLFRSMATGEVVQAEEIAYERSDGVRITLSINSAPVRDLQGQITMGVAVFDNITERKRAEQALLESEEKYRLLADHSNDWIYWIKPDKSFQYVSPSSERVTGFTPLEFMQHPRLLIDIVHPEDRERIESHLEEVREGGETHNLDYRILTKNKEIHWMSHSCEPVYSLDGKYMGRNGTNRDITERKHAEAEITRLAKFPTENPSPILRVQADGRLSYANEASQELLEVWQCHVYDYVPEELRDFITVAIEDKLNKTVDVICNDKIYSIMLVPIVEGGYVNIYGRDITERKRAEEALKGLTEDLRRSNAELEQFAYVASHDLQEPLRMVSSYMQLLKRRYQGRLDNDADEFIAYAVDGATRMQALINDLLAFSRVGTRGRPMGLSSCEKVLGEALMNLQVAIDESGAAITHDPLPTVFCDQPQLVQVFQNLIGNAIKFRAQQAPCIHVAANQQENEWLFSVRDNGIGLDPKFKERIFEIFQRLHSRTAYPGTGIGLAICKRIIQRHGGRIWVESQPGEGATFYFSLPIKETL